MSSYPKFGKRGINKIPLLLVTSLLIFQPVYAVDVITHIDTTNATPIFIWAIMATVGFGMFLYTLRTVQSTPELETQAILSVIAWIPIAFTAVTSFKVDRVISSFLVGTMDSYSIVENHVIYTFDLFGIGYAVLLIMAIVNTIRILALHKKFKLQDDSISYGNQRGF